MSDKNFFCFSTLVSFLSAFTQAIQQLCGVNLSTILTMPVDNQTMDTPIDTLYEVIHTYASFSAH